MRPQVRAPQQPAQPRGPQLPRAGSGRSHRPSLGQQAATLLAAMVAVMGPVMPAGALEEASGSETPWLPLLQACFAPVVTCCIRPTPSRMY